jgi:DNA (cytosine-5)-methyltransferase 1
VHLAGSDAFPKPEGDLFGAARKKWVPARDIIDWKLPAGSIYERKKPLSPKTMNRIFEGLRKFGLKPFVVPQHSSNDARSADEPAPTVTTTSRGIGLAEPFLVEVAHGNHSPADDARRSKSMGDPLGTVPCSNRFGLAQPFIIGAGGSEYAAKPQSIDEPVDTVTTENHRALIEPFVMSAGGPECPARPVSEPLGTVLTRDHRALVEPYIVAWDQQSGSAEWSADVPLSTVTTKARHGVAQPFLVKLRGTNDAASVDQPTPTVTASGTHLGLAEPYIVRMHGKSDGEDIDKPLSTVTAHTTKHCLAEPFLVQVAHEGAGNRTRSVDAPLPTVCGNRGEWALCEAASLLPQQQGGVLRSVDEPAPTVATDGAIGLVEPYLVEYYGTGGAESIDAPLNTVPTKPRHALVRPQIVINGERYLLDIRFRMLQPHELALAQGFRPDYKFAGNKSEQVKQIGNAVPRRLARAIVTSALTQSSDVSWLK